MEIQEFDRYDPYWLRKKSRFQNRPSGKFSQEAEATSNPLSTLRSISRNDVIYTMPPQNSKSNKKRVSETPALTDSSKKQKRVNDAVSPSKKAGPVLDLGTKLSKTQDYVNSYALSLFEEVKVPLLDSLLIVRTPKTSASRLLFFGHHTLHINVVNWMKVVKCFWILWCLK